MRYSLVIVILAGLSAALQGCANTAGPSPSYLGLAAFAAEDGEDAPPAPAANTASHVSSNKVLGAMAFQKVTGRAVDPARLSGGN